MSDQGESVLRRRVTLDDLFALARRGIELEFRVLAQATVTKFLPAGPGPYGPLPDMVEVELDTEAARYGRAGDIEPGERFKPGPVGSLDSEGELVGPVPPFYCPVHYFGGAEGFLRFAIKPGDQGTVHFTDRALGRWLVASRVPGSPVGTVDPGEGATHGENLCDAFFVPGARSGPNTKPGAVPPEGVTLGTEDPLAPAQHLLHLGAPKSSLTTTAPTLELDGLTEVLVGAGAVDLIGKGVPTQQVLQGLYEALSTWVPVAMDGGLALKTALAGWLLSASALIGQVPATKGKVV